jgi:drug/metabolite transporter (DMT)-like permease
MAHLTQIEDSLVPRKAVLDSLLAWFFVIIWGSGFVATKVALQYTTPLVFLSIRYGLGILCLLALALVVPLRWPRDGREWFHVVVAGLLVHALNLGGSHYAQYLGLSAGTVALILAAQPLLTACIAALWMRERLIPRQWLGIALGLGGVTLLVWHKIDRHAMSEGSLIAVCLSLFGTTLGALYQRTFCRRVDLRSASLIQFAASLTVLLPAALVVEGWHVRWTWPLVGASAFLVIGASILALNAFHLLMRRGEATRVASLIYLTPVIAVLLEYLLFDVIPTGPSLVGMGVVCAGVALVAFRKARPRAP